MLIRLNVLLACLCLSGCVSPQTSDTKTPAIERAPESKDISALLSGTAFVTQDLEQSIVFYRDYLGFIVRRQTVLTSPSAGDAFGAPGAGPIKYASLVPSEWSPDTPHIPGLNFAEISSSRPSGLDQNSDRLARQGELVLAFKVTNIDSISRKMEAANVTFLSDLALSATGKSKTLNVLDPNGVRVQLYEYIEIEG